MRSSKMLGYIVSPNLTPLLGRQCYPCYSDNKSLIRLGNKIRVMDLFDYFRYHKDRNNMIAYLRDGFTKCILNPKHIELCCDNGLLFEALPLIITKEHANYMANISSDIIDASIQFGLLLEIMCIYADKPTKEEIRADIGEFFPLLLTHGRTLVEQLKLHNSEQISRLMWSTHDIYDMDWGINYELVNILAKNLIEGGINDVVLAICTAISNGEPIDMKYIVGSHEFELLIAYGHCSVDDIIEHFDSVNCMVGKGCSHELTAVLLCYLIKYNLNMNIVEDFVIDDCEYCQRIRI